MKRLYSGKVVVFGQKWLYLRKVVVLSQSSCIRERLLHWGKVVAIGQKWLYSGKVVVFLAKVVVFG